MTTLDRSRLEWDRVILERRHWTSISVAVVAAAALTLSLMARVEVTSPFLWFPVLTAIVSMGYWIVTVRAMGRVQRLLHRPDHSVLDLQFF